jgi:hypothetical protein
MTLHKYLSHPSLVIYFFPTSAIKLKLALQIGGRLLLANHLDQSLWLANEKQGVAVISYLPHSLPTGVRLCCAFYQTQQTLRKCRAKTILLNQRGILWLLFIQIYCARSPTEHCWECSNTFPIKTKNLQSDCITSSPWRHIDVTQPSLVSGGYKKWKPDN